MIKKKNVDFTSKEINQTDELIWNKNSYLLGVEYVEIIPYLPKNIYFFAYLYDWGRLKIR